MLGRHERLSPPVISRAVAAHHPGLLERREELGDGRGRDGGTAGELGPHDLSIGDRLQRQVLRNGERRVVRSEQALDPAAHERRRPDERLRRLTSGGVVARARH